MKVTLSQCVLSVFVALLARKILIAIFAMKYVREHLDEVSTEAIVSLRSKFLPRMNSRDWKTYSRSPLLISILS